MKTHMPERELLELFGAARDGELTDQQSRRLESLLDQDDKALRDYVQLMTLHGVMKRSRQPRAAQPAAPQPAVAGRIRRYSGWIAAGLAAMLVIAAAIQLGVIEPIGVPAAYANREASWIFARLENGAANLSRAQDLDSPTLARRPRERTPLRAGGDVDIHRGRAYLDLFRGPEVMIEGPALFTLSHEGGMLQRGTLAVRSLDEANAFNIATPTAAIAGSSAEAAVVVDSQGATDVYVLRGRIEARLRPDSGESPQRVVMFAGEMRRFDGRSVGPAVQSAQPPVTPQWIVPHGEAVATPSAPLTVRFDDDALLPYDDQDGLFKQPSRTQVLDGGRTLRLSGNCWKRIDLDYHVTPHTVVEFEYRSTSQGELHGIAFDTDNSHRTGRTIFQLCGRDTLIDGIYAFRSYRSDGQWQRFRISVGQFYTGRMRNLLLFADDDALGKAQSEFRDVRILEDSPTPTIH